MFAPIAVATPDRTPPARLLRRTTAVEAPGVATSGTVIAAKAQTFSGTAASYEWHRPLAGQFRMDGINPQMATLPLDSDASLAYAAGFALAADIYPEWQREQARRSHSNPALEPRC